MPTSLSSPNRKRTLRFSRPLVPLLLITATCNHSQEDAKLAPEKAESVAATESPDALRAAYIAAAQSDAPAEFRFRTISNRWQAENATQQLVATPSAAGLRVLPGATVAATKEKHQLELSLSRYGCEDELAAVAQIEPAVTGNRVDYVRGELTEWYVNGPLGVEQGFTLAKKPRCKTADSGLELEVAIGDALIPALHKSGDKSYVELRDAAGGRWLRYSDVYAMDARSQLLPTELGVVDGRIRIKVKDAGASYPITIDPLVWTVLQQVQGSDTASSDFFGRSLAISGTTAVIGAFQASLVGKPNAGAAYVFTRSGTAWTQQQKLVAPDAAQDAAFGFSVAISGNSVVVGSPGAAEGGKSEAGAAYVYTRSGTTWTFQQRLAASDAAKDDQLGNSVAIDTDTVVVGADFADVAGKSAAGAAYVYVRSGTTWTEQRKLVASDGNSGDHFGQSASLSGNSVAIGAPLADVSGKASAGAAYVFLRSGTMWTEQQKLTAGDPASGDGLGSSIALLSDTVFAGAPNASVGGKAGAGAAYVYGRVGVTWTQKQKLSATAPVANEAFGSAVAQHTSTAVIGAESAFGGGAAYIFSFGAGTWTQAQILVSPLVGADGSFGRSAAIEGDYALVGAPFSSVGGKTDAGAAIALALGMTKPNGQLCAGVAECTSGFCVDGVCCNSSCGGGATDCQSCSVAAGAAMDGSCGVAKAGAVCRSANGVCDAAESCDGTSGSCPTDSFKASTTQCRGAAGLCDVAEFCTGTSAACPSDNLKPNGSECRSAIGVCDTAESCTGTSSTCPADSFKANTTECRAAAGPCDVADFCTGTGPSCATDQFKPNTVFCRAAAGLCDSPEYCTGTGAACPSDSFMKTGTECRAAAGLCDAAETCTGTGADCPVDSFKSNTSECRKANGLCDSAEFCSGTGIDCPTDQYKPTTATCRSAAGACDVAEFCTGGSPACPSDSFAPSNTTCRAAASACDAAETCTGTGAACPDDRFQLDGSSCMDGSCQIGMCRKEVDLAVMVTPSALTTRGQDPVSLQIMVSNLLQSPAGAVKAIIEVQKSATLVSGFGDGWACQSTEGAFSCERTRLDPGSAPVLSGTITPPKGEAAFTIATRVSSAEFDTNPANNSVTLQITNEAPETDRGCAMAPLGAREGGSQKGALLALGILGAGIFLRRRRLAF